MKHALLVVTALVASGCTFGVKTCTEARECGETGRCVDGLCVVGSASGGGGGQGGGTPVGGTSGGGAAGGMSGGAAGGTTGGGSAGGFSGGAAGGLTGGGSAGGFSGGMAGGSGGGTSACPCTGVGQLCVSNQCVVGNLRIELDPVTQPLRDVQVPVTGRVVPSSTEVLPAQLDVTTSLTAPLSVNVRTDGSFEFPLSARLGQYGRKRLVLGFMKADGSLVEVAEELDVRAAAMVEQLVRGLPLRNAAWRFPDLGITEFTPRVADVVIYRVTTEFPGTLQLALGARLASDTTCVPVCPSCRCFLVSLLDPLQRLVSVQPVRLDGGVEGKLADGGLPETTVTLLRWEQNLDAGIVTQPLIESAGRVVVATDQGRLARFDALGAPLPVPDLGARELVSLTFDDGTRNLGFDDVTYVSGNLDDGGSRLWALQGDGGISSYTSSRITRSALALARVRPDDAGLGVLVHFSPSAASGKPGQLFHATPEFIGNGFDLFGEDETPTTGLENLVVSRSPGDAFSTVSLQVRRATGQLGVTSYELPSLNVFADAGFWSLPGRALGLAAPFDAGPGLVASTSQGVTRLPGPLLGPPATSPPTLDRFGGVWIGTATGVTWLGADGGTASIPGSSNSAVNVAPVLVATGVPRAFSWVYAVTETGEINGISAAGASPTINWRDSLPLSSGRAEVRVPLTVTCDRGGTRQNAILYVVSRQKLLSLAVPGREPDVDAPWPMQRRDPSLTGNSELRLDSCR